MRDFLLVSYKMIRVDYKQFDKHFCFLHCVFVFKNKPKWSFLRCTQVLKIECAMECPPLWRKFVSYKHTEHAVFSYHICRYIKEMVLSLDIINEYFWNSPSKQVNSFDCLCCNFLWEIISKNEKLMLVL